jgi:DNA-directed RNA polymerase
LRREWSKEDDDLKLGRILLELAEDADLVVIDHVNVTEPPWKTPNLARPSERFRKALKDWGEKHHDLIEQPFYLPMIVPPNSWGPGLNDGGYLGNEEAKVIHLVKHRNSSRIRKALRSADLSTTLTAINALQQTPWRVNARIYGLMCKVREMIKSKELERTEWTKRIFRRLRVCENYANESEIYFPYVVDFRGRVYCLPPEVNPQADDIGRSLLEFAVAKPLGDRGDSWLAVHLANSFGQDKTPYKARVSWVKENQEMILACASDPRKDRRWTEAPKPWRFLRACIEWEGYRSQGVNFESRLPILMDGTCNGLQHLSALTLSMEGAKETNLLPDAHPQDIYKKVASDLESELKADQEAGNELAREWREKVKIGRDVCKMAVMTTPYGVTGGGITLQLRKKEFTEILEMHGCSSFEANEVKHAVEFFKRLQIASDSVASYVWKRFSSEAQETLASMNASKKVKILCVVEELNMIRDGASLRDEACFSEVPLTPETVSLGKSARSSGELARLNRLFLEDAYPRYLSRKSRRWQCCEYLSAKLLKCIGDLVDPGNQIKNWLQKIARKMAEMNVAVFWVAPTGFPVIQEKWQGESVPVRAGKHSMSIYKRKLEYGRPVLDADAQASGIVANFIHSLDAAHLMLTVRRLHAEDLGDPIHFGVIHDGYAVHACDVDKLHIALREEFIGMYKTSIFEKSVLRRFRDSQEDAMGWRSSGFPSPPEPGAFDIELVRNSIYFFC